MLMHDSRFLQLVVCTFADLLLCCNLSFTRDAAWGQLSNELLMCAWEDSGSTDEAPLAITLLVLQVVPSLPFLDDMAKKLHIDKAKRNSARALL